jgi:hypothetical protein
MNLQEQLLAAIAASEKAFNDGNVDEGNAKLKEAESIKARLDGVAKAAAMRPTLPGAGEGNLPKLDPEQPAGDPAVKAAYVKRFGAADDDIKAILTDLHGADYQSKYWAQKSAFTRYIRGGEKALDFEQRKLLKEIVFTPAAIKAALDQGVADVKVLKSTMVEASDTWAATGAGGLSGARDRAPGGLHRSAPARERHQHHARQDRDAQSHGRRFAIPQCGAHYDGG